MTTSRPCVPRVADCEQSLFCSKICKRGECLSSEVARVAKARSQSTRVGKNIEETYTTLNRSSARRKEEKQHKLHMNISDKYIHINFGLKHKRLSGDKKK